VATSDLPYASALVWFRRDLRDFDHAALYHALTSAPRVYCAFVFDTDILDLLRDKADRRVEFIWESARELKETLRAHGGDLIVRHGRAEEEIPALAKELAVEAVYANRDYEPCAKTRDSKVAEALRQQAIAFHDFKDQVVFERDEILTQGGTPYGVFTPYKNAWLRKVEDIFLRPYTIDSHTAHLARHDAVAMPSLETLGFARTNLHSLALPIGMRGGEQLFADFLERIDGYKNARDYPGLKGPSYLSVHLRFGTVSIRHLARTAWRMEGGGAETWLSELIWREFYFQILHHHPELAEGRTYKPEFDTLPFPDDMGLFEAWCEGRTGYPLVDAAMRQLNQSGYMHNRLRMVAASFLVKDLLVDWRRGERYFAEKLIDYDFAANNGGWQWAASTGCDAQPWFRIFNPVTQSERFDGQGKFIRKYVPELASCNGKEIHAPWTMSNTRQQALGLIIGRDYPLPVVDHAMRREQALALYKSVQPAQAATD
jgi:deoxyribodipyrimidine photo-lyase